ncbi:hypothetical protein Tco_1478414 [Tanacetum coccineum]
MCSWEACAHDSHKVGNWPDNLGTDPSTGGGLGCHEWICIGIGGQCDYTSIELVHPAAPSKRQSFPNAHLADPSSTLDGLANHLGSCCGRCPLSPQLLRFPLLHRLLHHHLNLPPQPLW